MLTAYADLLEQTDRAREGVSEAENMAEWFKADGSVHGPNVETVTMPQSKYLAFRRSLLAARWRDNVRPGLAWFLTDSADYAKQLRLTNDHDVESLFNHPPAQAAQVDTEIVGVRRSDLRNLKSYLLGAPATLSGNTSWGEWAELRLEGKAPLYAVAPTAEPVAQGEAVPATDAEIAAWAERHDLSFGGSKTDARDAFEDAESHRLTRPAAPAGVPAAWPKLELWFFRELVEAQRLKLFALHGMPVDEIGASHIHQKRALRQLLAAAPSQGEPS